MVEIYLGAYHELGTGINSLILTTTLRSRSQFSFYFKNKILYTNITHSQLDLSPKAWVFKISPLLPDYHSCFRTLEANE
jgi:hypothetical protein